MTIFGCVRVSTDGQSLASQDAQLHKAGCAKVYAEKLSGARTDRPELAKVLEGAVIVPLPGGATLHIAEELDPAPEELFDRNIVIFGEAGARA